VIIEEIKLKFQDKEGSENRYIRTHIKPFDSYELLRLTGGPHEPDEEHERSREIIEDWRDSKQLKGYIVVDNEEPRRRKGQGKGKSKLFSYECIGHHPDLLGLSATAANLHHF
jgi:hypothetical protein